MDGLKIQFNQEILGEIPYLSLPAYRLFCEYMGFQLKSDQQEKKLHLVSGLQKNKIYLLPMKQTDTNIFILEKTKEFLIQANMDVILLPADSPVPTDGQIVFRFKTHTKENLLPRLTVLHSRVLQANNWAGIFKQESSKYGFAARIKQDIKSLASPVFDIKVKFPSSQEKDKQFEENISMILASTLFRILTQDNPLMLLPLLPFESIRALFLQHYDKFSNKNKELSKPKESKSDQLTETKSSSQVPAAAANQTMLPPFRMEVCFDHQLILPTAHEEEDYFVLGTMYLKNTGLGAIQNPHICIQVPPSSNVRVKGQIIPPKMTDTVGVQSYSGDTPIGWKYVDDDWRQKAKELGEYWVCPIQQMTILPGETITFPNLQFSIPSNSEGDIKIHGSVHIRELNLKFPSSNRISLSFY